jgi:hypothetical protein
MNKKILFITYAFPPYDSVGAVRTGKTAKKLIDLGYDVKVVSALNQDYKKNLPLEISLDKVYYADWIDINWPINKLLGIKKSSELKKKINDKSLVSKIIRFFKFLYSWFLHIPDRHIGWYFKAVKKSCNIIDDGFVPNIILSSAPPYTSHLVAKKVSKNNNIPWIAEFRDLWSDNHYRKSGFFDRWLEKRTMHSSSAMITVSKPLTQIMVTKYKQPLYTIQSGYDAEDFNFQKNDTSSQKINIVYTGSIYEGKRDPSPLFKALSSCKNLQKNVVLNFYGNSLNFISDLSKEYNLESIVNIHESIPRSEILNIQKKADILLLLTWNSPKEKGVLTRKFFEYIASGNAILSIGAIKDTPSEIVVKDKFGIASNDPEEITKFINSYYKGKYNNNLMTRNKYDRQIQINKLAEIIDKHAN